MNGSFNQQLENGNVGLSLYYSEFSLADTDTLQTRKYGGTVRGDYRLTSDLNCTAAFTAERYNHSIIGSYTRRILVESGLSYALAHELTIALNYTFVDYFSPGVFEDNKHVNRAIIQLRKVF